MPEAVVFDNRFVWGDSEREHLKKHLGQFGIEGRDAGPAVIDELIERLVERALCMHELLNNRLSVLVDLEDWPWSENNAPLRQDLGGLFLAFRKYKTRAMTRPATAYPLDGTKRCYFGGFCTKSQRWRNGVEAHYREGVFEVGDYLVGYADRFEDVSQLGVRVRRPAQLSCGCCNSSHQFCGLPSGAEPPGSA